MFGLNITCRISMRSLQILKHWQHILFVTSFCQTIAMIGKIQSLKIKECSQLVLSASVLVQYHDEKATFPLPHTHLQL